MAQVKEQVVTLQSGDSRIGVPCAVCSSPLAAGEEAVFCPRCKSGHHLRCWIQQGGCGRRGCRQVASRELLPEKVEAPIRPSKIPPRAIAAVVAAILFIGGWLVWNARNAAIIRANTMTVMVPSLEDDLLWRQLVDEYNEDPPTGKRLELIYTPYGPTGIDYEQKLLVLLAARDGPEVVVLEPDLFSVYLQQEFLTPVDEVVAALVEQGVPLDAARLAEARREGTHYGIPHPERHAFLVTPVVTRHTGEGPELLRVIAQRLYELTVPEALRAAPAPEAEAAP